MKKTFPKMAAAMLTLLVAVACSDSASTKLLDTVPDDATLVMYGDIKTVMSSAGVTYKDSKIKMPEYIEQQMKSDATRDIEDFNNLINNGAIDIDYCVLTIDNENTAVPYIIFRTDDTKKFVGCIEEEGFSETDSQDGVTYYTKTDHAGEYYNEYSYIALKGDIAYYAPGVSDYKNFHPVVEIGGFIDRAGEHSLAKTAMGEYISEGNAGGMAFRYPKQMRQQMGVSALPEEIRVLFDGTFCFKGDLSGSKADVRMRAFDTDGKPVKYDRFKKYIDINAKVDKDALKFMGQGEQLVMAMALKDVDWDEYLNMLSGTLGMSRSDRAALTLVKSYLEKIDGTVAIGLGVTNGLESFANINYGNDVFGNLSFTAVVETVDGKTAKSLANDLQGVLEATGLPCAKSDNGFSFGIPYMAGTVYCGYDDDFLVLASHPVSKKGGNATVDYMPSGNFVSGLVIDAKDPLMKGFGINESFKMSIASGNDGEAVVHADITGKYGAVGNFLDMVIKIGKYFDSKRPQYSYTAPDEDYEDYEEYEDW